MVSPRSLNLDGKNVAVIGLGSIGKAVVYEAGRMGAANILGTNRRLPKAAATLSEVAMSLSNEGFGTPKVAAAELDFSDAASMEAGVGEINDWHDSVGGIDLLVMAAGSNDADAFINLRNQPDPAPLAEPASAEARAKIVEKYTAYVTGGMAAARRNVYESNALGS